MTALPLPAILDTAAAPALRDALAERLAAGEPLSLDGSAVERIGQACLQVLLAAQATGAGFAITDASPALSDMTALAGLSPLLAA